MKNEQTFTFHEYGKQLGIGKWKRYNMGRIIAATYRQIFGEAPPKVDVKHGSGVISVNVYPSEFKQIVDNVIKAYNKAHPKKN